jgi:hypothetical protein
VQAETELEIPLENEKENVNLETKSPKVKTLSEEEHSFTTVSKDFMRNGIQQMIDASNSNSDDDVVKQAKCSTVLTKFSSVEDISLFPYLL